MFNQFQKFERTKMRTEKKQKKPEGSINVDFVPKDSQKSNKKSSDHDDYVPFEEV